MTAPDEQPMPVPNEGTDIQSLVAADIWTRRQVGIERYGTALQAHNGRDALRDAYEEALDLAMYLRQAIEERDTEERDTARPRAADLPRSLVEAYAERAALHARTREVDPGAWIASVAGLDGAYGDGTSAAEAEADLREAVAGWVAVRRRRGLSIPPLEGLDLN